MVRIQDVFLTPIVLLQLGVDNGGWGGSWMVPGSILLAWRLSSWFLTSLLHDPSFLSSSISLLSSSLAPPDTVEEFPAALVLSTQFMDK